MADFLIFVGVAAFGVALVALVRGHLDWARIANRKIAAGTLAAGFAVMMAGGAAASRPAGQHLSPPTPSVTASAQSVTSFPMPSDTDAESSDPEANPTNTAPVNTSSLPVPPLAGGVKSSCRSGNPLANVYHPWRLQVVSACTTVSGEVASVRHEDDGDYHINLALDSPYAGMTNDANREYEHGDLVVEIVPADEPGCTRGESPMPPHGDYNFGICTGDNETPPSVGEHVWVTGPYVIDHWHNWTEIHPAWSITTTAPATTAPKPTTVAAAPPPAPATTAAPKPAGALTCSASMSNPQPAPYSTTDVIVRTGIAGSEVTATAHYKSTDTTHTGRAGSDGIADIPFRISRATKGYTVVVDVTVSANGQTQSCSTSFTPE